jgi:hypothetical protein|nr:MAG TPA: hypothetical protein [Caudoviricetes sp.]
MMDAIKFVKQLRRMNEQGVPKKRFIYPCAGQETDPPEEVVAEVEEWAKEHPAKTRQSVFLEQYPEAAISKDGAIAICPLAISAAYRHGNGACNKSNSDTCADCKRQFWSAEVEE